MGEREGQGTASGNILLFTQSPPNFSSSSPRLAGSVSIINCRKSRTGHALESATGSDIRETTVQK